MLYPLNKPRYITSDNTRKALISNEDVVTINYILENSHYNINLKLINILEKNKKMKKNIFRNYDFLGN